MDKRPFDTLADPFQQAIDATEEDQQQQQQQAQAEETERAKIKRTRIRQACERCKSRKTKCNNQRPCAACSAAGVACTDWRPGEEPVSMSTTTQALENANYDLNQQQPVSLNELDTYIDPTQGRPSHTDSNARISVGQGSSGSWPAVPAQDRHQRIPYPYDLLYRNERGLVENSSASGGLSHIAYLARIQQESSGIAIDDIPAWPNRANERPVGTPNIPNIYDMVEAKSGWKIIFMLVRSFLETTYVLWPTFHLPRFLATLATIKTNQNTEFIALLLAIAYMSLRERRTRKDLTEDTGNEIALLYWEIRNAEPGRDWTSPTAIQGMLYLSIGYSGGAWSHGAEMGRTTLSEAVTKCLDTGLHRHHSSSALSKEDKEEGTRTFWAVYCFDKMAASSGRPPLLRLSDIDQEEIIILDPALQERISPEIPSLLAYHRTAIRLYMIMERIVNKINIPSCSPTSAIKMISQDLGTRRYDDTTPHPAGCEADHRPSSFATELSLLDKYQYSDIPLPSRAIEEDAMYHSHLARIRSLSAFCRLLIASHLFSVSNSDRQSGVSPELRHTSDILRWSDELLESQRPAIEKGSYPDCGSTTVTQVAQIAKSLLPVIHLLQVHPDTETPTSLQSCIATFQSAIHLLHLLRPKFDVVIRHLDPLESYARQLGVPLSMFDEANSSHAKNGAEANGEDLIAEALGVLANDNTNQASGSGAQQPVPTSGSGAIQALLSLSGRTGESEGDAGMEGVDAWWTSILNGSTDGLEQR